MTPQRDSDLYWGYNAVILPTFSDIFKVNESTNLRILIDIESDVYYSQEVKQKLMKTAIDKKVNSVQVFFSGKGLSYLHQNDELSKIQFSNLLNRFDFVINPMKSKFGVVNLHLQEQVFYYLHELFNILD